MSRLCRPAGLALAALLFLDLSAAGAAGEGQGEEAAVAATATTVLDEEISGRLVLEGGAALGLALAGGGEVRRLPLADLRLIEIERPAAPATPPPALLELRGGGTILGALAPAEAGTLRLVAPDLGELVVPLEAVALLRFTAAGSPALPAPAEEGRDVVYLLGEQRLEPIGGVVEAVNGEEVSFSFAGEVRRLPAARLAAVAFASGAPLPAPAGGVGRAAVRTAAGSLLFGRLVEARQGGLVLRTAFAGDLLLPAAALAEIELDSPRLVWVSALPAEELEVREERWLEVPGEEPPGPGLFTRDCAFTGGPLRLRGREYSRGLGAHARCLVALRPRGRFLRFAAVAGIDDSARGGGRARFVVRGDGRVLWERELDGRAPAAPVGVDLTGVERLELLVDFGAEGDVLARGVWAAARLVLPAAE